MEKETLLQAFYRSQIATLAEQCTDTALLDLLYKLLKDSTTNNQ